MSLPVILWPTPHSPAHPSLAMQELQARVWNMHGLPWMYGSLDQGGLVVGSYLRLDLLQVDDCIVDDRNFSSSETFLYPANHSAMSEALLCTRAVLDPPTGPEKCRAGGQL